MLAGASAARRRFASIGACAGFCLLLAHCSDANRIDPRYGVSASRRVVEPGDPVPKGGGSYRVGSPYVVGGRVYVPDADPHYRAEGLASWYGEDFHGRATANGEVFDLDGISAAHPTMPLPSYARVTNLSNGRSLIVRVNDRGPFHGNRIIDVSGKAARLLNFYHRGTAWVRVEYVGRAPMEGSDDRVLEATLRQDEPAPPPGSTRTASLGRIGPIALVSNQPHKLKYASALPGEPTGAIGAKGEPRRAAPSVRTRPVDGTDQFLNGRGLY